MVFEVINLKLLVGQAPWSSLLETWPEVKTPARRREVAVARWAALPPANS